jgi:hypothetical protein
MPTYRGSCHCGAVAFEVTGEIAQLEECNCSLCRRNAYVHWHVDPSQLRMVQEGELVDYQFGTRTSHNTFCATCGISPFRRSRSDPDTVDVNVRCLDGVDLATLEIGTFDGVNWEQTMESRR